MTAKRYIIFLLMSLSAIIPLKANAYNATVYLKTGVETSGELLSISRRSVKLADQEAGSIGNWAAHKIDSVTVDGINVTIRYPIKGSLPAELRDSSDRSAWGGRAISMAKGIKGGVSASTFYGPRTNELSPRFASAFGLFFNFGTNSLAFQTEVMYVRKGANEKFDDDDEVSRLECDYIEVPLLVKFSNPMAPAIRSSAGAHQSFYVGPVIGFVRKVTIEGEKVDDANSPIIDLLIGADACWGIGGSGKVVYLDGRLNLGLSEPFDDSDIKHLTLTLLLGIGF